MSKIIFVLSSALLTLSIAFAQATDCSINYSLALTQTEAACNATSRNQACYGNNTVNLVPFEPDIPIQFNKPGDVANIETIRTLSLSALDEATDSWGIAMMRLLANLSPSQTNDVTILLFGDVEVETSVEPSTTVPVTTASYSNIRRFPNTTAAVVTSVAQNTVLSAIGRTEDSSWIQIVDETTNIGGWIFGELLFNLDSSSLDVVESTLPYYGPMQAFYYTSGSGVLDCSSVPSDGLLIQTPEGVGRVTIWVNEVTIDFVSNAGSTAFIQAPQDEAMTVDIVEGEAFVGTESGGYVAVAGSTVSIDQGNGTNPPSVNPPAPSSQWANEDSPIELFTRPVEPSEPATVADIAASNGLTTTQYDEVVDYGYVITEDDNSTTSSESTNNANDTDANTDTGSSSQNNNNGCNGNSCNAPGQNGDCNGNSCNAPGQNGNNGNGNSGGNGKGKGKGKNK